MFHKSYSNAVENRAILDVMQAMVYAMALDHLRVKTYREKEIFFGFVEEMAADKTPGVYDEEQEKFFKDVAAEAGSYARKYADMLREKLPKT